MPGHKDLKHHAALVDNMAGALGLDLEEQAMRGNLPISQIEDAVLSCTNCTCPGACQSWLDARSAPAEAPPNYCRNTALFLRLRGA